MFIIHENIKKKILFLCLWLRKCEENPAKNFLIKNVFLSEWDLGIYSAQFIYFYTSLHLFHEKHDITHHIKILNRQ